MKITNVLNKIRKILRLVNGISSIYRLLKKYKKYKLFFVYGKGIGDVCIEAAYLDPYVQDNKINGKIIVRENLIKIAKQMHLNEVIAIDDYTATCIEESMHHIYTKPFYYNLLRKEKIYILDPWFYADNYIRRMDGISASNIIKKAALNIQQANYKRICPAVPKIKNAIEDPFVIINPYSNSMNLDFAIWNEPISYLKKKGYTVYTNVTKNQEELPGTVRLEVSIEELYNIAGQAKLIVSIRSGIMDYIISNSKNMIVVYNGYYFRDFYSLDEWEDEVHLQQIVDDGTCDLSKQIIDSIQKLRECKNNG